MSSNVILESSRLISQATKNEDIDESYNKLFSVQEVMQYLPPRQKMSRNDVNV